MASCSEVDLVDVGDVARRAGCCTRCLLRLDGRRDPQLYQLQSDEEELTLKSQELGPTMKRIKHEICVCCLGLLQPEYWDCIVDVIKSELSKLRHDCEHFACGLSLPASMILREHSMKSYLKEFCPDWDSTNIVPYKQAWKWSFGSVLSKLFNKTLDSGAVCQYLITLHMDCKYDAQELECVKNMVPDVIEARMRSHKKFRGEAFTRMGIDSILEKVSLQDLMSNYDCPPKSVDEGIKCSKIEYQHDPIYIGGRYVKYSRELCQTPWIIEGKKIMDNSIQEIIFDPLADFFNITSTKVTNVFKFISSGREDVDVRCLDNGRPFAIEILNPSVSKLTSEQLNELEIKMNRYASLLKIKNLQQIPKDDLVILKSGEEEKTKTYLALCIKIGKKINDDDDKEKNICKVTDDDFQIINSFKNRDDGSICLKQKTPLRVLHRRPLLVRNRKILKMRGSPVENKPDMFTLELTTEAGTYIKEFIHGDFGRTQPNLSQILGCEVDILALDVIAINLQWPVEHKKQ